LTGTAAKAAVDEFAISAPLDDIAPGNFNGNEIVGSGGSSGGGSGDGESRAWTPTRVSIVVSLFLLAGLLEIGGGWLIWIYIRGRDGWAHNGRVWWVFLAGALSLTAYGVVPALQPLDDFGRVYAAYGGIFIAMAFLWAHVLDGYVPDTGDIVGSSIALLGVMVILFWPRD
jgi:small multidrug resistance family-3 protein